MSLGVIELPELVLHIDAYLEPCHSVPLACSSRSMFYAIMPRLWKHVYDVSQIFALFPVAEVLDQGGTASPMARRLIIFSNLDLKQGSLAQADYSRLELYAPWVEHLALDLNECCAPDRVLDVLRYYSSTRVVLPNLRFITSTSHPRLIGIGFSWLLPLLSPALVSLDLIANSYVELVFPPLPVLLHTLSTTCPNLHSLAVIQNPGSEYPTMNPRLLEYATDDYATVVEDLIKRGPGPALDRVCPLVSFTTSLSVLDHFCWDVISAWPSLERLEIIAQPIGPSYSLPEIPESAFPSLIHLALHQVDAQFDTFHMLWSVPALVRKLTSFKLVPAGRLSVYRASFPLLCSQIFPVLVERSPGIQDLWLDVRDPDVRVGPLMVSISTLDVLRRLPLQTLHIEGLYFLGCENVPGYFTENFPRLKGLGLPGHGLPRCLLTPDA